jgi:hypothetical protein
MNATRYGFKNKFLTTCVLVAAYGCSAAPESVDVGLEEKPGTMGMSLQVNTSDDVSKVRIDVWDESNQLVDTETVTLEKLQAVPGLSPRAGDHMGGDAYFVVYPGNYKAVATPLQANDAASSKCAPAQTNAKVVAGETTEVVLVMQCQEPSTGGLDVVVITQHPPVIQDLTYSPSKFVSTCEQLHIHVDAVDEDGDTLGYLWSIERAPEGVNPEYVCGGPDARFKTRVPGHYVLKVVVSDPMGGKTSLTFPVHVGGDMMRTCNM